MASKHIYVLALLGLTAATVISGRADGGPKDHQAVSPYTPVVLPEDKSHDAPAQGSTFEVHCDDPLEKTHDCQRKARDLCHGDFRQLKFTETNDSERSALHAQIHGSTMSLAAASAPNHDAQRSLLFACGSTKK